MQSIPPTTANKQTQAQKKRGSMARKMLGANAKSYRLELELELSRLVSTSTDCPPASTGWQPPSTALMQDLNALGPWLQLDLLRDWPKLALQLAYVCMRVCACACVCLCLCLHVCVCTAPSIHV